jgi:hypothetical protein
MGELRLVREESMEVLNVGERFDGGRIAVLVYRDELLERTSLVQGDVRHHADPTFSRRTLAVFCFERTATTERVIVPAHLLPRHAEDSREFLENVWLERVREQLYLDRLNVRKRRRWLCSRREPDADILRRAILGASKKMLET